MNDKQRALLDAIREFKPDDQTELQAALNLAIAHADTIKRMQSRIATLESLLDWISIAASNRSVPREH